MRKKTQSEFQWISLFQFLGIATALVLLGQSGFASEAELKIPPLTTAYNIMGNSVAGTTLLGWGMVIAVLGMIFGIIEFFKIKGLEVHKSMLEVSDLIYETCKTYMIQQGKFLAVLEIFI